MIVEILKLLHDFVETSNFIEQKYQARLREQAIKLLDKLLSKLLTKEKQMTIINL